jgi:hypothetical protein
LWCWWLIITLQLTTSSLTPCQVYCYQPIYQIPSHYLRENAGEPPKKQFTIHAWCYPSLNFFVIYVGVRWKVGKWAVDLIMDSLTSWSWHAQVVWNTWICSGLNIVEPRRWRMTVCMGIVHRLRSCLLNVTCLPAFQSPSWPCHVLHCRY